MVEFGKNKRWFWFATRLCVAIVTFAIGIAANWAWTRMVFRPSPPMQQQPVAVAIDYTIADIGTLKRRILESKANGENTVELFVLACGWDIGNLRNALSRDTVVLAELVGRRRMPIHGVFTPGIDSKSKRRWWTIRILLPNIRHSGVHPSSCFRSPKMSF